MRRMARIEIYGLANEAGIVDGHDFDGDTIVGPAMLAPLDGCKFQGNNWGDPFDQVFHRTKKSFVVGVIGLWNVSFTDCSFEKVGFMGPDAFIDAIGKDLLDP